MYKVDKGYEKEIGKQIIVWNFQLLNFYMLRFSIMSHHNANATTIAGRTHSIINYIKQIIVLMYRTIHHMIEWNQLHDEIHKLRDCRGAMNGMRCGEGGEGDTLKWRSWLCFYIKSLKFINVAFHSMYCIVPCNINLLREMGQLVTSLF